MSTIKTGVGKAFELMDKRRLRALRYAAAQLETVANDNWFTSRDSLRDRFEKFQLQLRALGGKVPRNLASYRAQLAVAAELDAAEVEPQLEGADEELIEILRAFLAARSAESSDLETLDAEPWLDFLHPRLLVEWGRAKLRCGATREANQLAEVALARSPSLVEAYRLLAEVRHLEGRSLGTSTMQSILLMFLDGGT